MNVLGACVVCSHKMLLVDRMPPGAARVLDRAGTLNRKVRVGANEMPVRVSWDEDGHKMVAVPSAEDAASFFTTMVRFNNSETRRESSYCVSVYIIPEDLPHLMAAQRLMRLAL